MQALSLDWDAPRESLLDRLRGVIGKLDEGDGVLILTDLFGDTPSNLALGLIDTGRVEVVTGVNLPMVLRLACQGSRPQHGGRAGVLDPGQGPAGDLPRRGPRARRWRGSAA